MERTFNTSERGSREWGSLNPMQNDKISMFGLSRSPQKPKDRGIRPGLLELMKMEPRRQQ